MDKKQKMGFRSITTLTTYNNVKQQLKDGILYTDEEIINICEEYNNNRGKFSLPVVTDNILKDYHHAVEKAEKEYQKELQETKEKTIKQLKEIGLTLEEFESLTPLEKAQLNMLYEITKNIKNITGMKATSNIVEGFSRL